MRKLNLLIITFLGVFLLAYSARSDRDNLNGTSREVVWQIATPDEIHFLCNSKIAIACTFRFEKNTCIIITVAPPTGEFGPLVDTHTGFFWQALSHEMLHCFDWKHKDLQN